METRSPLALAVLILTLVFAATPARAQAPSGVHDHVLSVLDTEAKAWSRGNLDSYLATYPEDARWASGNTVIRGREQMGAAFLSRFDSVDKMGALKSENVEVDVIGTSDAVVFGEWVQTLGDQERRGVFTLHVKPFVSEWLIVSDHTSGGQ